MSAMKDRSSLWSVHDGTARLEGVRCSVCKMAFFPPQHYGCENCGAVGGALADELLPATGVLHGFTTVFLHSRETTPFQVGEVMLDSGPMVRARLSIDAPKLGTRVAGRSLPLDESCELFFTLEEASS